MVRKPKPVAQEVAIRLSKAADVVDDTAEAWKAAIEHRDAIILESIDVHGAGQQAVAKAARVSKSRISAILVNSQPEAAAQ